VSTFSSRPSSRWYDPALGRFLSPDSVVPDKGNPIGLDRYAYVANNPISRVDESSHCWGVASGIRGLPSYGTTCNNLDMALTIVQSDQATAGQKAGPGAYIGAEGLAHTALVVGSVACLSNVALCVAGAKTALGIGGAATEAACADGDCGNEVNVLAKIAERVTDKLQRYLLNPDHPVGGSKAKWFEQALGYTKDNLGDLAKQIVFDPTKAVETGVTQHGTMYNQVITITGANGKQIDVTFACIKNLDGIVRLVTAIPTDK